MLEIVISYPTELPNELALVNNLLDSDIDYFHIRKPEFEEIQMITYIEQINEEHYHKIVIHNNYHLAKKYNLGGIHLNQKGLKELRTEAESDRCYIEPLLLKNNQIFINNKRPSITSYSAHSFEDITNLKFEVDYLTLSPIFDSISKPNYQSKFTDRKALSTFLSSTDKKVIALGGVTRNHSAELKKLGFSGYAILGDFWKNSEQTLINKKTTLTT